MIASEIERPRSSSSTAIAVAAVAVVIGVRVYVALFPFHGHYAGLNVFRYETFRSLLAGLAALALSFAMSPVLIERFRQMRIGQTIRDEVPKAHQKKAGTPTMGGLLILAATVIATLVLGDLRDSYIWLAVFVTLSFGGIGLADDMLKLRRGRGKGLSGPQKLVLQFSCALAAAGLLFLWLGFDTHLTMPFFKNVHPDWGPWFYIPFAAVMMVGFSNAVNLTDGLDGLAIGPVMTVAFCYWVFTYAAGNLKFAEYLQIPHVAGAGELSIFCGALIAASLGFLWYNAYPASMMMGDVGALSLGAALAVVAILAKQELALFIAGGIFVIEAGSVIIQRYYFKLTRKRFFRMAPLHHHFELLGWPETVVTVRFWIVSAIFMLVALSTLKLR